MHTWTPTVTPELESTAFLYARSILTDAERLERRIRDLERERAAQCEQCEHGAMIADLRERLAASETERRRLAACLDLDAMSRSYQVGRLRLDLDERLLELDGRAVRPSPIEMRILAALARYPERLIVPARLMTLVYGTEHARPGNGISTHWHRLTARLAPIGADRYLVVRQARPGTLSVRGLSAACEAVES